MIIALHRVFADDRACLSWNQNGNKCVESNDSTNWMANEFAETEDKRRSLDQPRIEWMDAHNHCLICWLMVVTWKRNAKATFLKPIDVPQLPISSLYLSCICISLFDNVRCTYHTTTTSLFWISRDLVIFFIFRKSLKFICSWTRRAMTRILGSRAD